MRAATGSWAAAWHLLVGKIKFQEISETSTGMEIESGREREIERDKETKR